MTNHSKFTTKIWHAPQNRRKLIQRLLATTAACSAGLLKPFGLTSLAADTTYDCIVVGSGAAGMTAALTAAKNGLSVLVIEKADRFGGSTARSGGGIWIRNNEINEAAGIPDSFAEAAAYLEAVVGDAVPRSKQLAFLTNGPATVSFLLKHTPLRFRRMPGYSDYYPDLYGGKAQGASIEPEVFDGNRLGRELKHLAPPYIPTPPGVVVYAADYKWLTLAKVTLTGAKKAAQAVGRFLESKWKGRKPLTMGQALAAGLRVGLLEAKVPLWLNTRLLELQQDSKGRVDSVLVERGGRRHQLQARHGVVIAAGGFEHNLAMRRRYQQQPINVDWTVGAPGNTGDGIRAGQRLGADLKLMDDAWWGPTIPLSADEPYFCLSERSLPGSLLVNADGHRFVNESAPYHDVVNAMYRQPRVGDQLPIWMITDHKYRNRYLFKDILPGSPLPQEWYDQGAVVKADSLADLARQIDLPVADLKATVATFNSYAAIGEDPEFQRGGNAYDRYYADPGAKPNPSLAPLTDGPFYAFRMIPGDLGTKGGLRTDARSRVMRADGTIIEGLYAAGNSSDAVMGRSYAGNGATLGPAMTFGYIAGQDIAARRNG